MSKKLLVILALFMSFSMACEKSDAPQKEQTVKSLQVAPAPEVGSKMMSPEDVVKAIDEKTGLLVLDVRSKGEYDSGHVPHAMHIPFNEVQNNLDTLRKYDEKGIAVLCQSGYRTEIALGVLKKNGFKNIYHIDGDMAVWYAKKLPLEK